MSRTTAEAQEELFSTDTSDDMNGTTVAEGHVLDFITGEKHLKDRPKEYDDDLPVIPEKYKEFRQKYAEPGT